jgi:hypothetical protein
MRLNDTQMVRLGEGIVLLGLCAFFFRRDWGLPLSG